MKTHWTAETWPIAAAMIPFPATLADGRPVQEADPVDWAHALRKVARAGFDAVDPTDSWLRIADLDAARLSAFMDICRDLGLAVPAISTARRSVIDPEHGDEYLDYSHRVIDTAAGIGAGYVSFGFFGPLSAAQRSATWFWTADGVKNPADPAIYARAVTRIRELARHAEGCGVQVALEMYEDTYIGTAKDAVRFVTEVDHPSVRLNVDIGNLIRLYRPVERWEEMIALCAPFAGYWHIKNYYRMEDSASGRVSSHPAPLLGGTINWRAAIDAALELGFDSPFLVEHYGGDGLDICALNRDYIRSILSSRTERDDQGL
ncbi:sugar phosphate isomerase/epimerase family protein [Tropicimonas sp.]|uniref:sugar phosphate isomerase/epimerase family protein n=1 Tax=Tropicimonas sp. TaxID=2067044 RepID=UPI003A866BBF